MGLQAAVRAHATNVDDVMNPGATTESITRTAPRPLRSTILTQQWRELTFLHWPVDAGAVAPLLPPGTVPDLHDGTTWVGLVAFRMWRIGLGRTPGLPYLGTFPETNVRLYAVDAQGRRGVVFRSLEATRLLPVLVARSIFALPYMWSQMRLDHDGVDLTYTSRRRWPERGPQSYLRVRVGEPLDEPTPLEDFLTARWGLHVDWRGRTLYLPNTHPAWPLRRAELLEINDQLVRAAGLPGIDGPPVSVLYSPGVPVRFGPPSRV
jgi:uncharacterized protein YqjF (DUF2071 family)